MDWGVTEPRLVAIYPGDNRVLSGYQVADELVVTAAHHVVGSPRIRVSRVGDAHRFDAELAWGGESDDFGEIDAAVLRVPGLPAASGRVRWVSHVGSHRVECRIVGFPNVSASVAVDGAEPVAGTYLPGTGSDLGKLVLTVTDARPADREGWQGLSGAAVRDTDDRIMAIVVQHDDNRHPDTLTTLPIHRLLAKPEVAELLGTPTVENVGSGRHLFEPTARPLDLGSPSLSEFDLITARHQVVPYVKPKKDLIKELSAWCFQETDRPQVSVRLLTGGVGSGKTRLAAELCKTIDGEKWKAGFASSDETVLKGRLPMYPLLIVFDYAEINHRIAREFVEEAIETERALQLTAPLRVMLVARSEGEWLANLSADARIETLLGHHPPLELAVEDFDLAARRAHRDAAFERFTQADMHPAPDATPPDVDGEGYETPLMVHIAALLAAKGQSPPSPDSGDLRTKLLKNLVDQEISRINDSLDSPASSRLERADIRTALTIATLTTPTAVEAVKLFTVDERLSHQPPDTLQHLADKIHMRHSGPVMKGQDGAVRKPIAAIEPDLISQYLTDTLDDRTAIIERLFTQQELRPEHRARLLSLLALTGDHHPDVRNDLDVHLADNLQQLIDDPAAATSLHGLLVDRLPQLLHAAVEQATVHQRPEAAAQLAAALDRYPKNPHIGRVTAATSIDLPHPNRHLAHLAVAYRRHQADHLRGFGRSPVLARTLNDLAEWLAAAGREEEAHAVAEEAVITSHLLVWGNRVYLPDLAASRINLAHRLDALGRWDEAVAVAQRAVADYRRLAQDNPSYEPAFAMALHTLAIRLGEVGPRDEAETMADEAVSICRRLAAGHPSYQPVFALALHTLAIQLREVGRRDKAEAMADEAVKICYGLAGGRSATYPLDFTMSPNSFVIDLDAVGGPGKALAVAEEVATIYQSLFEANPTADVGKFVTTLLSLVRLLALARRHQEARMITHIADRLS